MELTGIWVPLVTPLDDHGRLDGAAFDRLVDHVVDGGVDGLWVNGTTSEFHALSDDTRAEAVRRAVARAAGRVGVAAHVGDPAPPTVHALARAAVEAGVDHVAALPPYYLRYSQAELASFYRSLAEAIGRPVVVYDFPLYTKVAVETRTVVALAREGAIRGIKESAPSLDQFRRLVLAAREAAPGFRSLHGAGGTAAAALFLGADGLVCALANVLPRAYSRLVRHARDGDWSAARADQDEINRLGDALAGAVAGRPAETAPLVAALKWWLREEGVLATDALAAPATPLTGEERAALARVRAGAS